MIALYAEDWYPRLAKLTEQSIGLAHRTRIHRALVEQVPRDQEKVHAGPNSVIADVLKGASEVVGPLGQTVLLVAQMHVRSMNPSDSHTAPF